MEERSDGRNLTMKIWIQKLSLKMRKVAGLEGELDKQATAGLSVHMGKFSDPERELCGEGKNVRKNQTRLSKSHPLISLLLSLEVHFPFILRSHACHVAFSLEQITCFCSGAF